MAIRLSPRHSSRDLGLYGDARIVEAHEAPLSMLRYQDVFVPGGFPKFTYNPRIALDLEGKVKEATENLCKLVTVTGQTKSGKTVLVRKVLPREDAVWIDGGTATSEDEFWQAVVDQLELFQGETRESGSSRSNEIGGEASAEANFIVARGQGQVSVGLGSTEEQGVARTRLLSSRIVALRGLAEARLPLVIDDFHYLPRDVQGAVVRALKPLVFEGVPVVIIAIPHRRYDALKVEREMTGRIHPVEIPSWSESELAYIPSTGFTLLNLSVDNDTGLRFAHEAIGSPHLMQDFCRGLCRHANLAYSEAIQEVSVPNSVSEGIFAEVAETIGRPIFEKLARGPRQRTDRIQRDLRDGSQVDIYELVLRGLAHLRPGLVSIEYEELRGSLRQVSASQPPQLHEVARVLKHMSTIAATDQSSTPVIDFEDDDKKLHITDPFFAFYLRWGTLAV